MKHLIDYYKGIFKGGRVACSEDSLEVYDKEGNHCISLNKNGAGQIVDMSVEYGCTHRHSLSPAEVKKA